MAVTFKRDSQGLGEVLKMDGVAKSVHAVAEKTAAAVQNQWSEADVVVDDYVTDRAASSVTIREPDAHVREVRDGILSRAAAGAGLEVTLRR